MPDVEDIIGKITNPYRGQYSLGPETGKFGLITFLNNLLRLVFVFAGLYAFLKLIIAGYQFMSAGGDPKAVEKAWAKIWQSLIGLLIIVASFVLAALFGWLLFGNASAILVPTIYGPGGTQ
ncbi:hypothetical protein COU95_01050 [Candidatus Shapirobacteria bacterium CG10_big_fil_rev_8_21_14_0_10_40_9]|uniref:Uncharacterized protein n=1 Tax=Candidatus Shapirobacteria bacterium CG10_big_fil_rev_8_21_14_0_10_40_9 TaxID=1974888 RepID=A0A2M8L488_9BACT|nr:MAG: hypothetical protein COU95_01050 [Candidatus Shapirobacteria bacterium CG10_big_fil_rev_8_21_14_0_10_40_9]